jgi:hypothetical protein
MKVVYLRRGVKSVSKRMEGEKRRSGHKNYLL